MSLLTFFSRRRKASATGSNTVVLHRKYITINYGSVASGKILLFVELLFVASKRMFLHSKESINTKFKSLNNFVFYSSKEVKK